MTVQNGTAKRTIKVPRGTISLISYTPPKLPEVSPVSSCSSFGRTRKGMHIVPRFYISPYTYRARLRKNGGWIVIDMEEAKIAAGTDQKGYPKKEAKQIAKKYRDRYGSWAKVPF